MFLTLIIACASIVLLFLILPELYKCYTTREAIKSLPVGNDLFVILKLSHEERLKWSLNMHKLHDGFFRGRIFHHQIIHTSRPEHVEIILSNSTNIEKSFAYNMLHGWLGNGLLTSSGKKWFSDRKLITPAFHFNILSEFAVTMSEKAVIFGRCIENKLLKNPGEPIDVLPLALNFGLDALCETSMGTNLHVQETEEAQYPKDIERLTDLVMYRVFRPWLSPDWVFALTSKGKEYFIRLKRVHEFTRKVVQERQKTRRQKKNDAQDYTNDDIGKKKEKLALLDLLLIANEEEMNPMTDEELREHVDTFMFAGHDTTAVSISWTLFCLGNDLEIQDKLHEELDDVFGDSNEPVTMQKVNQLKYLERVIKESLRIYPSAPEFSRKLSKELQLENYTIPKDCTVTISVINVHRNTKAWSNPEKFDPDRFLPENVKERHPYAYIPFSAGPRNCIGQKYAQLENKIALSTILRKWKVKSVKNHENIKTYNTLTLKPIDGIYLYFIPKK